MKPRHRRHRRGSGGGARHVRFHVDQALVAFERHAARIEGYALADQRDVHAGAGGVPLHHDEAGRLLRPFADAEQTPAAFGSKFLLFEHFDVDRRIARAVGQ